MAHTVLTEDIVGKANLKLTSEYNPEHLLQWAHCATLQMKVEILSRKREWEAMLQDGQEGREAKFEVRTFCCDPTDCMDMLTATIYYTPNSDNKDYIFAITERILAIGLAGAHTVESPLFNCETEQQLKDYLDNKQTPFKRYLHLEHIMEQLANSDAGRRQAYQLREQQKSQQS